MLDDGWPPLVLGEDIQQIQVLLHNDKHFPNGGMNEGVIQEDPLNAQYFTVLDAHETNTKLKSSP